jgi:hypothetical protein
MKEVEVAGNRGGVVAVLKTNPEKWVDEETDADAVVQFLETHLPSRTVDHLVDKLVSKQGEVRKVNEKNRDE